MKSTTILIATNNTHKVEEMRSILQGFTVISLKDVDLEVDVFQHRVGGIVGEAHANQLDMLDLLVTAIESVTPAHPAATH